MPAHGARRGRSARALRAAGLIEGGEHGLTLLEEAVQVLDGSPAKLEHAKARTELGAALRRANRRPRRASSFPMLSRWPRPAAPQKSLHARSGSCSPPVPVPASRPQRRRLARAERAARRRAGGRRAHQPRDRPGALRHPEDGRGSLDEHLPQARDQFALATRGRARRTGPHLALPPAGAPLAVPPKHFGSDLGVPTMRTVVVREHDRIVALGRTKKEERWKHAERSQ